MLTSLFIYCLTANIPCILIESTTGTKPNIGTGNGSLVLVPTDSGTNPPLLWLHIQGGYEVPSPLCFFNNLYSK